MVLPLQAGSDLVSGVALGFDQKLLMAGSRTGSGDSEFVVVRVDPDGTLDDTFGAAGVVTTDLGNRDDVAAGVAVDGAGFIVVAGWAETSQGADAVVVRYSGAGALDAGFGVGGVVRTDVGTQNRFRAVAIGPGGAVVAVGASDGRVLVARYDEFGVPDPSFGSGGVAVFDPTPGADEAHAVAVRADGSIILVGEANGDALVARLLPAGGLDPTFGAAGLVVREVGGADVLTGIGLHPDGSVVAGGATTAGAGGDGFVLALDPDGAWAAGFGTSGLALTGLPGADGIAGVDLSAAGNVVAAGWRDGASDEDATVMRFTTAGGLDPAFGVGGVVETDFGSGNDRAVGVAVERSGRIVTGVLATNGTDLDPAVVRVFGDPPAAGDEFLVNTYTTGYQIDPQVAVDGSGRFVVVWSSQGGPGTDTAGYGIRAQRFRADGEPVGTALQVNTYTTGDQMAPAVAADTAGNFVVVWQSQGSPGGDQSGTSVLARAFDPDGVPLGPEFQVNTHTNGDQIYPRVAADAAGDFVVVWESATSAGTDAGPGSGSSIQARSFAADGTPLDAADIQVNTATAGAQRSPVVTMGGGGAVIAWDTDAPLGTDTSPPAISLRRFDGAGNPAGPELQVNDFTTGVQAYPAVAAGGDGRYVVVWHGDGDGDTAVSGFGVFGKRFSAGGTPDGGEFLVPDQTSGEQILGGAAYEPGLGFVGVWQGAGPGDGFGIFGRRFGDDGVPQGPAFRLNRDTADAQQRPAVASGPGGEFVVVWETYAMAGADRSGSGIAAVRFDTTTVFTTTSTVPGSTTTTTTPPSSTTSSTSSTTLPTTTTVPAGTTTTSTSSSTTTTVPGSTTTTAPGGTTTSTSTTVQPTTTLPGGTTSTTVAASTSTSTSTSTSSSSTSTSTTTTVPGSTTTTAPGGTTSTSTTVQPTTTLPGGTTTSTTLPATPLRGTRLLLKVSPAGAGSATLKAKAKDPSIALGRGNGSEDDPVVAGGDVEVRIDGEPAWAQALPSDRWRYIKRPGKGRGYKAKRTDAVRAVLVKPARVVKVIATLPGLGPRLETTPQSVDVLLRLGGQWYCMRFSEWKRVTPGRKVVATTGVPIAGCPR